jgi:hypothetical protein
VADCCECGNKPFGAVIGWEFIETLIDYRLLSGISSPWKLSIYYSVTCVNYEDTTFVTSLIVQLPDPYAVQMLYLFT